MLMQAGSQERTLPTTSAAEHSERERERQRRKKKKEREKRVEGLCIRVYVSLFFFVCVCVCVCVCFVEGCAAPLPAVQMLCPAQLRGKARNATRMMLMWSTRPLMSEEQTERREDRRNRTQNKKEEATDNCLLACLCSKAQARGGKKVKGAG